MSDDVETVTIDFPDGAKWVAEFPRSPEVALTAEVEFPAPRSTDGA